MPEPDFSRANALKPHIPHKLSKKKVNYVDVVLESSRSSRGGGNLAKQMKCLLQNDGVKEVSREISTTS